MTGGSLTLRVDDVPEAKRTQMIYSPDCPDCNGTGKHPTKRKTPCPSRWCVGGKLGTMCDCECHDQPGVLHIDQCCTYCGMRREGFVEVCRRANDGPDEAPPAQRDTEAEQPSHTVTTEDFGRRYPLRPK